MTGAGAGSRELASRRPTAPRQEEAGSPSLADTGDIAGRTGEGGASLGPPQPPVGGCHSGRHEGGRPEEARLEPCQRGMVAQEELDDQGQHVPRRRGLAPSPHTHTPPCFPTSLNPAPPVSGSWALDMLYRALRSLQGSPGSVVAARRVFGGIALIFFLSYVAHQLPPRRTARQRRAAGGLFVSLLTASSAGSGLSVGHSPACLFLHLSPVISVP